jgi:uncharacterized damage-inducible protein DinB
MESKDLIRDNLKKSADRGLAHVEDMRELAVEDLDTTSAQVPKGREDTVGTDRLCLQYVADHWHIHRGQLADARRAAGVTRMWM